MKCPSFDGAATWWYLTRVGAIVALVQLGGKLYELLLSGVQFHGGTQLNGAVISALAVGSFVMLVVAFGIQVFLLPERTDVQAEATGHTKAS